MHVLEERCTRGTAFLNLKAAILHSPVNKESNCYMLYVGSFFVTFCYRNPTIIEVHSKCTSKMQGPFQGGVRRYTEDYLTSANVVYHRLLEQRRRRRFCLRM